jgi:hypothetical protein
MSITVMLFLLFTIGIPMALCFFGFALGLLVDNPYSWFDKLADACMKLGGAWLLAGCAVLIIMIIIAPAMV